MVRIEAAGETLHFLPPYSPDFNPIEKTFSRLKAMLRKAREQTGSGLWDLIGRDVDIFQPAEGVNYFKSCAYEPERAKTALVLEAVLTMPGKESRMRSVQRPRWRNGEAVPIDHAPDAIGIVCLSAHQDF